MKQAEKKNLYIILLGIGVFPFLINGYINSKIHNIPLLYWGFEVLSWIIMPAIVLFIVVKYGGLRLSEIGYNQCICGRKSLPLIVFLGLVLCLIDHWLYTTSYEYFSAIFPAEPYFTYKTVMPKEVFPKMLVAIYFGLSAGIVEEFYYRALMFRAAQYFKNSTNVYVVSSPVIFSLVHWEGGMASILAAYIIGLFFVLVFLSIRNIWPLIIGHIYTDFMLFS